MKNIENKKISITHHDHPPQYALTKPIIHSQFGDEELLRDRIIVEEMYYHCDFCGEQLGRITNHELFVTKENEELLNEARRILR